MLCRLVCCTLLQMELLSNRGLIAGSTKSSLKIIDMAGTCDKANFLQLQSLRLDSTVGLFSHTLCYISFPPIQQPPKAETQLWVTGVRNYVCTSRCEWVISAAWSWVFELSALYSYTLVTEPFYCPGSKCWTIHMTKCMYDPSWLQGNRNPVHLIVFQLLLTSQILSDTKIGYPDHVKFSDDLYLNALMCNVILHIDFHTTACRLFPGHEPFPGIYLSDYTLSVSVGGDNSARCSRTI